MTPRVHKGKSNKQGRATAVRHASKRSFEAVGRRSILAGALLAIALLAMLGVGSFSSGAVIVQPVTTPAGAPAALIFVPAQDRLVSVDPVLNSQPASSRSVHVSQARVRGVGNRRAKLSFTLTAGKNAAAIKTLIVTLPRGIAFPSSRNYLVKGIVVKAGGKRLKLTAKVSHGRLTIQLKTSARSVRVTIASPAITVSKTLAHKVRTGIVKTRKNRVTATNTSHKTTRITLSFGANTNARLADR